MQGWRAVREDEFGPGDFLAITPNRSEEQDNMLQGSFQGPSDLSGGGGGGYVDSADGIGRNSDPNWMKDGQFDDAGAFSSDHGAAGRAFWRGAEISGGALRNYTSAQIAQITSNTSTIVVGGPNSGHSMPLVTQLNQVNVVQGQTSYVKSGEVHIRGTWSVVDADDDANQGGTTPTQVGEHFYKTTTIWYCQ